ncbi:DUF1338 domain-containing protein [Herbaspirillum sp. WKF16]|jgi:hypothetical protein|uniref:DUF1338 domain-containing protein n=1 Tax=Herbaspirillum sp. WKF16 TaxID=3028312 RepID=UPI0023A9438E|nr:DUF1338 domain-containing protein [Herbaspirillum sp. WKF16]WDZ96132.1 DUF1338 domain-containing protein [Herbaspirillum sp. WKF16]
MTIREQNPAAGSRPEAAARDSQLAALLAAHRTPQEIAFLLRAIHVPSCTLRPAGAANVSRLELAQALNMLLFEKLLKDVPDAAAYVAEAVAAGQRMHFDHGALRTVLGAGTGLLPAGEQAITRILRPLGYVQNGLYPLERIRMTGRSYAHADAPEEIAQFFVSELHADRFSPEFQAVVSRVIGTSVDPLGADAQALLARLEGERELPLAAAQSLLPVLLSAFARQHALPTVADYERLRGESSEMAWIATEGNVFNHATDRVPDVEAVAERQRALGRPMKDKIEVSRNGRVRQTAYRACTVLRPMRDQHGAVVEQAVPGSFYEFISRDRYVDDQGVERLDLSFDSGNAQGIFKMTAGGADAAGM